MKIINFENAICLKDQGVVENAFEQIVESFDDANLSQYIGLRQNILGFDFKKNIREEIPTSKGYAAPEMAHQKSYNNSADVWALGVIFYILLARVHPCEKYLKKSQVKYAKK